MFLKLISAKQRPDSEKSKLNIGYEKNSEIDKNCFFQLDN